MKRTVSVLVSVILLLAVICPFGSLAAGEPAFEVSSGKAASGSGVDVTVTVKNSPGIASIKLKVEFNPEMVLKKVKFGEKTADNAMSSKGKKSPVTLNWINWQGGSSGLKDVKGDFVFATLTFEENSNLSVDDYKVAVSYNQADVFNAKETDIAFKVTGKALGEVASAASSSGVTGSKEAGEPATDPGDEKDGYMNEEGNYVGGEEEIITEEAENLVTTGEIKSGNNLLIWICVAAAVLVIIAAAVVIILKKRSVKEIE